MLFKFLLSLVLTSGTKQLWLNQLYFLFQKSTYFPYQSTTNRQIHLRILRIPNQYQMYFLISTCLRFAVLLQVSSRKRYYCRSILCSILKDKYWTIHINIIVSSCPPWDLISTFKIWWILMLFYIYILYNNNIIMSFSVL